MYLTQAFFTLVFDDLSVDGRLKIAASFILSIRSAVIQASSTLDMTRCGSFYMTFMPVCVGAMIYVLVAALAVKFGMSFYCPHHVFSLLDLHCVESAEIATVKEVVANSTAALNS